MCSKVSVHNGKVNVHAHAHAHASILARGHFESRRASACSIPRDRAHIDTTSVAPISSGGTTPFVIHLDPEYHSAVYVKSTIQLTHPQFKLTAIRLIQADTSPLQTMQRRFFCPKRPARDLTDEYEDLQLQNRWYTPVSLVPTGVPIVPEFIRLNRELFQQIHDAEANVKNWKTTHSLLLSRYKYFARLSRAIRSPIIQHQCERMNGMRVQSAEMGHSFKETLVGLEFTEQKHNEWRHILAKWTIDQNRTSNIVRQRKISKRVLNNKMRLLVRARYMPPMLARMDTQKSEMNNHHSEASTSGVEVKGDSDEEQRIRATIRELKLIRNERFSGEGDEIYGIPGKDDSDLSSDDDEDTSESRSQVEKGPADAMPSLSSKKN